MDIRLLTENDLPAFPTTVTALHFGSLSLTEEPCGSAFEALMQREQRDRRAQRYARYEAVRTLHDQGRSIRQIARTLGVSLKTVQNHVSRILDKLQAADRTQAALRARGIDTST